MAAESSFSPKHGRSRVAEGPPGYLTLLEIARGGMGTVELAVRRAEHFSRLFAVKRLHPHFAASQEARVAFLQEGRVAALLRHASAVSVLDAGEDARGPYLVMQYVEGAPASQLITEARGRGELLPIQICVRACRDAAQGLHAAHSLVDHVGRPQGFLHRDVCPQNILLGFDGLARVTDFGVAQTIFTDQQTFSGSLKGKLRYMAPERLRFEKIDARADLFSLGVVLYEMLSGTHLFDAEAETEVAQQVLHGNTPDIGLVREGIPLGLVELLFQLLARDQKFRPKSASAVAARLDELLTEIEFDDGKVSTDAYMEEHFGTARAEMQSEIRGALESTLATLDAIGSSPSLGSSPSFGSSPSLPPPPPSGWWGRREVRAGAAALALVGLVTLGWAWARADEEGGAAPSAAPSEPVAPVASPNRVDEQIPADPAPTPAPAEPAGVPSQAPLVASAGAGSSKPPQRVRPARKTVPTSKRPSRPVPAAARPSGCESPFYYDEQGHRRVRRECL